MRFVIDANILVAAFLKKATTRRLLLDPRLNLFAPEELLTEAKEILFGRLAKKINLGEGDFEKLWTGLTASINVVPKEDYATQMFRALEIAPHEEDAPYVACSLHLDLPLWSNDGGLLGQGKVPVLSTTDLLKKL